MPVSGAAYSPYSTESVGCMVARRSFILSQTRRPSIRSATILVGAVKGAAVDEELVRQGRLQRISELKHLAELRVQKKGNINPRRSVDVIDQVVDLILRENAS